MANPPTTSTGAPDLPWEQLQVEPGIHHDQAVLIIRFPYHTALIAAIRKLPGATWSRTLKAWYVPDNAAYRQQFGLQQQEADRQAPAGIAAVNLPAITRFVDTLRLKGYSPNTERTYRNEFAQFLKALDHEPVDGLSPERIRSYMLHCTNHLKLSEATLHSRLNAIKFYVEQVLHRERFFVEIPRPKKPRTLPKHLSPQDVKRLFDRTTNPKGTSKNPASASSSLRADPLGMALLFDHTSLLLSQILRSSIFSSSRLVWPNRSAMCHPFGVIRGALKHNTMLRLCYGMGLRVSELVGLKVTDIDSGNMQAHIRRAKGKKDRYVPLPASILEQLRSYFREYRPKEYLFEGQYGGAYTVRSAQTVFKQAMQKAGINKHVGIHGLRHSYATHLLEAGTDIGFIQKLLGHEDIKTTLLYAQVTDRNLKQIKSPLDSL